MVPTTPHRRLNPLTGEWVLVSPHRRERPWLGKIENLPTEQLPQFDPQCYLCPGNSRAGGKRNPQYISTYVFDNDYPALLPAAGPTMNHLPLGERKIYTALESGGTCRVVCFSPRHDLTLPELSLEEVQAVVKTWADQTEEIRAMKGIQYVQVFENKGEMMGCSNPHPHSQIWASNFIPDEIAREQEKITEYMRITGECLICEIVLGETEQKVRVVCQNQNFIALVPFWAVWPFEVLLISRRHVGSLPDLSDDERNALADILRQLTTRYDNLFQISFPYSMGFHQSPSSAGDHLENHLHAHFYPPLLRSATVRKFMVGYEMLAMPQRDLTPEQAAEHLKSVEGQHYRLSEVPQ